MNANEASRGRMRMQVLHVGAAASGLFTARYRSEKKLIRAHCGCRSEAGRAAGTIRRMPWADPIPSDRPEAYGESKGKTRHFLYMFIYDILALDV